MCSIKVLNLNGGTTGGLYQVCLRAEFISKADRIIDYRPVPVSPLALKLFSIRHFFRALLDGTHTSLLSPPVKLRPSLFLIFYREINYNTLPYDRRVENESAMSLAFPEQLLMKDLNQTGFYVITFVSAS